jgi:hypothetical protein
MNTAAILQYYQYYTAFHPPWMLKKIPQAYKPSDNNDVKNAAFRE